jgi:hypothetical protein
MNMDNYVKGIAYEKQIKTHIISKKINKCIRGMISRSKFSLHQSFFEKYQDK